jgi:hypothetical protein
MAEASEARTVPDGKWFDETSNNPGATVNDAASSDYSAAGPFTRSGAEQFAAQLASRTALVYCKIVTEND